MANYNISIGVDTSGAITSLNALNSSLDTTQNKLNQAQQASNQATNNMGNGFGDLAQQLQNFDQGITKIIENFLKLKGVADELLSKSMEQFKKREEEKLNLKIVLNTAGAYSDINRFTNEILPMLAPKVEGQLSRAFLMKDKTEETKNFYESYLKTLVGVGNTFEQIKKEFETAFKSDDSKAVNNLIEKQLTAVQQNRLAMGQDVDATIKRLYETTKFSQAEVTDMFLTMISKGITPDVLLKGYTDQTGKQFTMLDKIVNVAQAFAPQLGEGGLNKSAELIYQILNTASLGEGKTSFNDNVKNLGTYIDQMITAFNATPLTIQNIGDVLVRNMGINQKQHTLQWSELLALAGKTLQAKSGAETGEYIHAMLRGYTLIQQNIDRLDEDKKLNLLRMSSKGQIKQVNTRATAKASNINLLSNTDVLKLTGMSGMPELMAHMADLPTDINTQINALVKQGNLQDAEAKFTEYLKTKGVSIDKGLANSMTTAMATIYREAQNLGKGKTTLTPDIVKQLLDAQAIEDLGNNQYRLLKEIQTPVYGGLDEKGMPIFKQGQVVEGGAKDTILELGKLMPTVKQYISGELMADTDRLINHTLDAVEKEAFLYNIFGNDLITTLTQLFMLNDDNQEITAKIIQSTDNLNNVMEELNGTLTQLEDINAGLVQGFFTSISNNAGSLGIYFEKIKQAMLSSKASIDRETSKSFDGMLGTILLILSVAGKVGAIIGTALALSASFELIKPYLTFDALGNEVGIVKNLSTRLVAMIPFIKMLSIGSVLLIGFALAIQKVFFQGETMSNTLSKVGSIINDVLIPAIVTGKNTSTGMLSAISNGLIAFRNLFIGFFNALADLMSVALYIITGVGGAIGFIIASFTSLFGIVKTDGGNAFSSLGYMLGIIIPLIYGINLATALFTASNFTLFATISLVVGALYLIYKFGNFALTIIGLLTVACGWLGISLFGINATALLVVGSIMLIVGAVGLLIEGFFKLNKLFFNSETISAMEDTYNTAKDKLASEIKSAVNIVQPTQTTPTGMANVEQLPSVSSTLPSFDQMPQIPMQTQAPITVNVTLKEAIIEPTSDVFLKRVANTLVPHIEQALNRGNVAMG